MKRRSPHKWTTQETEWLQQNRLTNSISNCAKHLRVGRSAIITKSHELGITFPKVKYDKEAITAALKDLSRPTTCYLLGLIWADGCARPHPRDGTHRVVTLSMKDEDMRQIIWMFDDVGKIHQYVKQPKGNSQPQRTITIHSRDLAEWLATYDYGIKSQVSPTKILQAISPDNRRYFLRGWSDGDGCWFIYASGKKACWNVYGTYDQDWTSLQNLLDSIGVVHKHYRAIVTGGRKSHVCVTRGQSLLSLGEYMYQGLSFGLDRKKNRYLAVKMYQEEVAQKNAISARHLNFVRANPSFTPTQLAMVLGITWNEGVNLKRRLKWQLKYGEPSQC